jgi:hypothetical protein
MAKALRKGTSSTPTWSTPATTTAIRSGMKRTPGTMPSTAHLRPTGSRSHRP